jgi:tetratricopeptide (TPR) repeat protein
MAVNNSKQQSTQASSATSGTPPSAVPAQIEEPTESMLHFFKPEDWVTALVTTLIAGVAFFYYMAPEVTLQDSGELVTGAFTFGVPHPPGYPLWALMGFIWSHFILPFGNPAWRMGMMSVVTGALTVGTLTIMMTRSIRLLLHSLPWSDSVEERLQHWMALTLGASTALLFGFNRGVWLWACVSEMRVLNVFSFVLVACIFFGWIVQPHRRGFLYVTLLLFGLSLANHQTISIMVIPLGVGVLAVSLEQFVAARRKAKKVDLSLFMTSMATVWELAIAGLLSIAVGLIIWSNLTKPGNVGLFHDKTFLMGAAAGAAGLAGLYIGRGTGWWQNRRALICTGLFMLGVSFYLHMPLAAATNPPMNWGYAATKEGFVHAVTRGQYQQIQTASLFSAEFLIKVKFFALAVFHQYSLTLSCFALVAPVLLVLFWRRCKPHGRAWMVFVCAAFLTTSIGLLTIINPSLDRQEQEINIKFFAPAHGFYAMLIAYGIAALLSLFAWWRAKAASVLVRLACVALLALPLISYQRNWALCNLRGHDFGYLFGYLMFNPGNGYEPMERDAVLYGGTDPGRFVPTYMIFCESRVAPKDRFRDKAFDRSDVYIITQNALADNTYMSYIRDHYDFTRPDVKKPETLANFAPWRRTVFKLGSWILHRDRTYPKDPIAIPSPEDGNKAFQEYIHDVQTGKIPASADIKIEGGRVSVQGVGGVMAINGILARWIFDRNNDKHAFYVEESYVIPWMYPFLRPYGVIMKIDKNPLPAPQENPSVWQEITARDKAYWDKLTGEFTAREDFRRNNDAKKSFSKMRSAIAGLYAARGLNTEAEYAFRQSLQLCPESPEANFRLADLYMRQRRYAEARVLIEQYRVLDPYNKGAVDFLNGIKATDRADQRRQELEKLIGENHLDISSALELAALYQRLGLETHFQGITRSLLDNTNLPPAIYMAVAKLFTDGKRWDMLIDALQRYLKIEPNSYKSWIDLGFAQLTVNKPEEGLASIRQAVAVGGEMARSILRQDPRFAQLQNIPVFRALVPPLPSPSLMDLPFARP